MPTRRFGRTENRLKARGLALIEFRVLTLPHCGTRLLISARPNGTLRSVSWRTQGVGVAVAGTADLDVSAQVAAVTFSVLAQASGGTNPSGDSGQPYTQPVSTYDAFTWAKGAHATSLTSCCSSLPYSCTRGAASAVASAVVSSLTAAVLISRRPVTLSTSCGKWCRPRSRSRRTCSVYRGAS
jgi:hypothetical protein